MADYGNSAKRSRGTKKPRREVKPFITHEEICNFTHWAPKVDNYAQFNKIAEVISNCLRQEAKKVGKDLDAMIAADPGLLIITQSVVLDVAVRYYATPTDQEPMTQFSQAAGGYSISGSYLVPGGGIYIKKSELARLGLRRQRMGAIDFYGMSD